VDGKIFTKQRVHEAPPLFRRERGTFSFDAAVSQPSAPGTPRQRSNECKPFAGTKPGRIEASAAGSAFVICNRGFRVPGYDSGERP
jgi:hypothetical protein